MTLTDWILFIDSSFDKGWRTGWVILELLVHNSKCWLTAISIPYQKYLEMIRKGFWLFVSGSQSRNMTISVFFKNQSSLWRKSFAVDWTVISQRHWVLHPGIYKCYLIWRLSERSSQSIELSSECHHIYCKRAANSLSLKIGVTQPQTKDCFQAPQVEVTKEQTLS